MTKGKIQINEAGSVLAIRVGNMVAYGTVGGDGETYCLEHAPSQRDFDCVAAALDSATPTEIRAAMAEIAAAQ